MGYKERMRVSPSNAQLDLRIILQNRGLHPWTGHQIWLLKTEPDFWFPPQTLPVYLDGIPVHRTRRQQLRDERINEFLMERKMPPLRIRYMPPLGKKRLYQAADIIEETLQQPLKWIRVEEV